MTTGDEPRTADEIAEAFMREHGAVLSQFECDDDGVCEDHAYTPEPGVRGMSVLSEGFISRPLSQMHQRRCADCPSQECVDCDWGDA